MNYIIRMGNGTEPCEAPLFVDIVEKLPSATVPISLPGWKLELKEQREEYNP